jgi:hypothetical protein
MICRNCNKNNTVTSEYVELLQDRVFTCSECGYYETRANRRFNTIKRKVRK